MIDNINILMVNGLEGKEDQDNVKGNVIIYQNI